MKEEAPAHDTHNQGLPLTTINKGKHIVHSGGEHASYLQVPVVPWTK